MTLRVKTLLLISGVLAALLLVVYCALRPLVMREFARVEQVEAKDQMAHILDDIQLLGDKQATSLQAWNAAYQAWSTVYDQHDDAKSDLVQQAFRASALQKNDLNFIAVVDAQHQRTIEVSYDETGRSNELPAEVRHHLHAGDPLLFNPNSEHHSGFISTSQGLVWLFTAPLIANDGTNAGSILFGRNMRLSALGTEFSHADQITVRPASSLTEQQKALVGTVTQDRDMTVVNDWLVGLDKQPVALMEMRVPNIASSRGEIALNAFGLVLIGCGLFSLMAAMVPLEKLVISPLAGLNGFIDSVRGSGDLSQRVSIQGDDEISHLATNINATFATLQTFNNRLRHSEHLFREMAQTGLGAGDAFFVLTQNSDELDWHGDIDSLLGYEAGGLPRSWSAWLEHIFLPDKGRVTSACARAFARREVVTVEFRVIRCDGTRSHWMLRGKALLPRGKGESFVRPEGEPLKMVGVCIDISERKISEEQLRASTDRLERIVETAADAIVIAEADGQISDANNAAELVFGLTREEIRERTFDDPAWKIESVDGTPFPAEESPFARVKLLGRPVYNVQYALMHADDRRLIVSVNAAPLVDGRGHFSGMVASVSNVTEQYVLQERLNRQANSDALTGLANRVLLRERLQHALMYRGLEEGAVAILFIDLDNFKYINDSLGHSDGDKLLVGIADRLRKSLRLSDTAARFGGDEFVILLEQMEGPRYAITVAERVLEALKEPFSIRQREVFTTPSIGITFSGEGYNHPDELLRQADAALYEAKRRGKARYEIYQSHLGEGAMKRLNTENDLRRALQKHEFSLRFQPKWDLLRNQLVGFEALVRWEHPERGLVPPSDFIPIAEETGLIERLGFLVLRDACFQAQKWRTIHGLPLTMAVNVSPHQLRMDRLVESVTAVLKETAFPPSNLILEITESAIVERTGEILQTLNALKDLGVSLAIDDFGTGYSALAYLRDFPFDYLKIDRQFVTHVNEPGGNDVIVQSMISLAHALELKVIAEGVEDISEAAHLKTLGCDMGQGYYFARPLTAHDVETRFGFQSVALPAPNNPAPQSLISA